MYMNIVIYIHTYECILKNRRLSHSMHMLSECGSAKVVSASFAPCFPRSVCPWVGGVCMHRVCFHMFQVGETGKESLRGEVGVTPSGRLWRPELPGKQQGLRDAADRLSSRESQHKPGLRRVGAAGLCAPQSGSEPAAPGGRQGRCGASGRRGRK